MDPDEALKRLREAVDRWCASEDDASPMVSLAAAEDMASAAAALDGWCSKGGFLPAAWGRKPHGVFVASIDTAYEVVAVADTEAEAVRLVSERAHQFLKATGTVYPETDTPAKLADYLGVNVTSVVVGTAEFVGNE